MSSDASEAQAAAYLRTLPAIRERCQKVYDLAKQDKLEYFEYHPDQEEKVIDFCVNIIKRDYKDIESIPPHGRWRHIDAGKPRVESLISDFTFPRESKSPDRLLSTCKRLVDFFVVSVLLDAGAGSKWRYRDTDGAVYTRSEGLGVASCHMFQSGFFSGIPMEDPYRVDCEQYQIIRDMHDLIMIYSAKGLASVSTQSVARVMQASDTNPMVGIEGRASLLLNLAHALESNPQFFGPKDGDDDDARPGNLIDYLYERSTLEGTTRTVPIAALWQVLIEGLSSIWPNDRTSLGGVALGDVWPCEVLRRESSSEKPDAGLVPFHKLTGWLCYSVMEPIQKVLGWKFTGTEQQTGLPEYRNGGLLVDFGVLALRSKELEPRFPPSHPAIIEWRAMTVIGLDRLANGIRTKLDLTVDQLSLAQILEAATWKGGREIAQQLRQSSGGGPPIEIESDGTVF